ncbi:hypothetical protein [Amycolatopsis sp. lyj-108]|uniref:hypothetical protein n=1 Tax=Amycolatopsis sp. lyj-108 TaxID=2789286 RepID=UPI00397D2E66
MVGEGLEPLNLLVAFGAQAGDGFDQVPAERGRLELFFAYGFGERSCVVGAVLVEVLVFGVGAAEHTTSWAEVAEQCPGFSDGVQPV